MLKDEGLIGAIVIHRFGCAGNLGERSGNFIGLLGNVRYYSNSRQTRAQLENPLRAKQASQVD
jgi:hypothetical protein